MLLCSQYISGAIEKKILICGICQDVDFAIKNAINNIEELARYIDDYRVIIYENNSQDNTADLLFKWSQKNPHALILSENLPASELSPSRTARIASARNKVLSIAKEPIYDDFPYLIMVDLDFTSSWPIQEILATLDCENEWDCVTANGISKDGKNHLRYWDRFAFRSERFPFGPELLGNWWWQEVNNTPFNITGESWISVFSAFGGLAIYKRDSIINFSYSGDVTDDLMQFYLQIAVSIPDTNSHFQKYKKFINQEKRETNSLMPIIFQRNTFHHQPKSYKYVTCCEHVTLHASMKVKGFDKIFINPKLIMKYGNFNLSSY